MRTKYILSMVFGLLFCNGIFPQSITDQLIQFYKNADMDCYLPKIQKNVNDYFILDNKNWGRNENGIIPPKIELHKEEVVPMLTIQFVNTDSINFNDDIYKFITIDSSIVFTLACVDKKMNVKAFAHFFDWSMGYYNIDNDPIIRYFHGKMKLKHIIKNINTKKPEIILYSQVLKGFHDGNGFMYIKNGKIYVYRIIEKDVYELNDYLRRFFSLDRIRKLNVVYRPMIYPESQTTWFTGHTPKNEKIICP